LLLEDPTLEGLELRSLAIEAHAQLGDLDRHRLQARIVDHQAIQRREQRRQLLDPIASFLEALLCEQALRIVERGLDRGHCVGNLLGALRCLLLERFGLGFAALLIRQTT
jgi:hypothetical protein